ncbi:hypothetical protein ABKN59_011707 [Abortiporus biennis]
MVILLLNSPSMFGRLESRGRRIQCPVAELSSFLTDTCGNGTSSPFVYEVIRWLWWKSDINLRFGNLGRRQRSGDQEVEETPEPILVIQSP